MLSYIHGVVWPALPQDLDSPLIAPTFTDGYHAYKDVPYEQSTVSEGVRGPLSATPPAPVWPCRASTVRLYLAEA